ncbi:hypothetical protein Nepgr_032553 [Nepenthes gracilis]|uniref:Expansin-like EG45 domain-containing protein n=1 Tax=Nepenthes gracilis TaxID=150966 RepID=A0AAD3TIU3_NEPGR|nr:hypothetical protein Nepgr_032553 [Nepenthes gracilis]
MRRVPPLLAQLLLISFFIAELLHPCHGEFGTASKYGPPYVPTVCYGNDKSVFPSNNLFAAAGDSVWDNGAACGRRYLVRCLSAAVPRVCLNASIEIPILDYAGDSVRSTMVLSKTAFAKIATPKADSMNIEFQEL